MENEDFLDKYLNVGEFSDDDEFEAVEPVSLFNDDNTPPAEEDEDGNPIPPEEKPVVNDVLLELLREKGISDPSQIKFENEDGEEERVNFYELPVDEQLEILRTQSESQNDLDDDEVSFINYLRQNQITPEEWTDYVKQQAVQEYLATQQPLESVESMSDDEIFLTDLFVRIGDITDEEAQQALDLEKQNENLYKRKVDALRADLLKKEQIRQQEEDAIKADEKAQSFEEFKQSLFDIAPTVKEIAGGRITLDDEDINETVDFLLEEDVTGTRYIAKALNDPASLIKMAWFYVKGEEAINSIADYYESQIKDYAKSNYEKGYEDAKNGVVPTKRVTTKPKDDKTNVQPTWSTIPQNPALLKKQ